MSRMFLSPSRAEGAVRGAADLVERMDKRRLGARSCYRSVKRYFRPKKTDWAGFVLRI
jgi:hypothetical protein